MNNSMRDDFKRDGLFTQIMKRITDLEAFEREFRLKQFGSGGGTGGALPYVLIEDQKASGTNAGTFTNGADRTRELNTLSIDTGGICSLAANRFTLDAGTYYFFISAPAFSVGNHQILLYNFTAGSELDRGTSSYSNPANPDMTRSEIFTILTLAAGQALEVRHRCQVTQAANGFGAGGGFGTETYTFVQAWQRA